jgi:hypothetical protein
VINVHFAHDKVINVRFAHDKVINLRSLRINKSLKNKLGLLNSNCLFLLFNEKIMLNFYKKEFAEKIQKTSISLSFEEVLNNIEIVPSNIQ